MKTPYEVLGVASDADDENIKKAYRKLALEWHPDRHEGDATAEERFKEINAAYQAIDTADKRRVRQQHAWSDDLAGIARHMGFGYDPFGRSRRSQGLPRVILPLLLEEAHAGCSKRMTVSESSPCSECGGLGMTTYNGSCESCNGTGHQVVSASPTFRMVSTCQPCRGTGLKPGPACTACGGSGKKTKTRMLSVEVPAGAEEGLIIPADGVAVFIRHAPHREFRKLTDIDILSGVEIDAFDAMLGKKTGIRTLAGEMTVRIAPGTQPGSKLRIAGAGLSHRSGRKGDHIVQVNVRVPELEPDQRAELETVWKRMARKEDGKNAK